MEKLLTTKEVAEILHCHPQTLYRNKELPRIVIPGVGIRFKEKIINEYIEQRTINPFLNSTQLIHNQSFRLTNTPENGIIIPRIGGICELTKFKSKTRYNFGFGAIYQRKTSNGKIRWYLDYYDADHKRVQKVAKNAITKDEAIIALREEVARMFDKEYEVKRKKEKIKFSEFADMYIENYAKSNKKSWKTDFYYLRGMKEFFSDFYLSEITSLDIEKYKTQRLKNGVQPSTVNRCLAILRKMFNLSVDWGYLHSKRISRIRFFSEQGNLKERILTKEEEKRLLKESAEHLKPILIIALNTGMRLGEILNLQWNKVDLNSRSIRVEKTKSGKIRVININSILLDEFLKLNKVNSNSKYLFFNPKTGKPITTVKTAFKAACRRASIKGLRLHDLRHTFASRLVEKGVDLITVKGLLGHSSVTITERYTHSHQEQKKRAVELLVEKSNEKATTWEHLLHYCDMERRGKKEKSLNALYSVN